MIGPFRTSPRATRGCNCPPAPRRAEAVETGIQTLALRRLDPFRGVIQLVIAGSARAASSDGWNWEIQVYADRPGDLWASEAGPRSM